MRSARLGEREGSGALLAFGFGFVPEQASRFRSRIAVISAGKQEPVDDGRQGKCPGMPFDGCRIHIRPFSG